MKFFVKQSLEMLRKIRYGLIFGLFLEIVNVYGGVVSFFCFFIGKDCSLLKSKLDIVLFLSKQNIMNKLMVDIDFRVREVRDFVEFFRYLQRIFLREKC